LIELRAAFSPEAGSLDLAIVDGHLIPSKNDSR